MAKFTSIEIVDLTGDDEVSHYNRSAIEPALATFSTALYQDSSDNSRRIASKASSESVDRRNTLIPVREEDEHTLPEAKANSERGHSSSSPRQNIANAFLNRPRNHDSVSIPAKSKAPGSSSSASDLRQKKSSSLNHEATGNIGGRKDEPRRGVLRNKSSVYKSKSKEMRRAYKELHEKSVSHSSQRSATTLSPSFDSSGSSRKHSDLRTVVSDSSTKEQTDVSKYTKACNTTLSVTPQKGKQSPHASFSKASTFRTPPKITWPKPSPDALNFPTVTANAPALPADSPSSSVSAPQLDLEARIPGRRRESPAAPSQDLHAAPVDGSLSIVGTPPPSSPVILSAEHSGLRDEAATSEASSLPLSSKSKHNFEEGPAVDRPNGNIRYPTQVEDASISFSEPSPPVPFVQDQSTAQNRLGKSEDYLDLPRVNGWHHNGYSDVKRLFKQIASDTVLREQRYYDDWFIGNKIALERLCNRVSEKVDKLVNKRFGYFVSRLSLELSRVPNFTDVDYLQRKVAQIFMEEVSQATDTGILFTDESLTPISSSKQPDKSADFPEGAENRAECAPTTSILAIKNPRSLSSGKFLPHIPNTASTTSIQISTPSSSSNVAVNNKETTRPSRTAAYTAASRITSQYAKGVDSFPIFSGIENSVSTSRSEAGTVSPNRKRQRDMIGVTQRCDACECEISMNNFNTHTRTNKHQQNAQLYTGRTSETTRGDDNNNNDINNTKSNNNNSSSDTNNSSSGNSNPSAVQSIGKTESDLNSNPLIVSRAPTFWCASCKVKINISHAKNLDQHLRTQKHRRSTGHESVEVDPSKKVMTAKPDQNWIFPEEENVTLTSTIMEPQRRHLKGAYPENLAACLAINDPLLDKPYKGANDRGTVSLGDRIRLRARNRLLQHVDFSNQEREAIQKATIKSNGEIDMDRSLNNLYSNPASILVARRDQQAVESQIRQNDLQSIRPGFITIESRVHDPNFRPARQVGSLLRQRELGGSSSRHGIELHSELRIRLAENIRPWRSFTGASHDVVTVAWAPNSMAFAAGAVAHSNPEDLQYNRPCNLLFGDLVADTIAELPDHRIDREKPGTGPNASQDMYNTCDPRVYKTVTTVRFRPDGNEMYSASEDRTVKVWDTTKSMPTCIRTLRHDADVTGLDVSNRNTDLIATASATTDNAIRIYRNASSEWCPSFFSSSRAMAKPEWRIYPETLRWGTSASTSHLLLAGFQGYGRDVDGDHEGHLCLWDANTGQDLKATPGSQAVHTVAWHSTQPFFASGGTPSGILTSPSTTKTVVRAWDHRSVKRFAIEYECPALEMTDITFHPLDSNIVTAGCTNSISYVWDFRWPVLPLHQLRHGKSVMPYGEKDTGVMMSLWGIGSSTYYTGSSDGHVRAWDIRRHPQDVLVQDVAQLEAGVQSGMFSPDGTHLLVGDATGGIHVLSSAPWQPGERSSRKGPSRGSPFEIIRATEDPGIDVIDDEDNPGIEGIEAGNNLIQSGQLVLDPTYGPGKGPGYYGPYAMQDREEKSGLGIGRLNKETYKRQPFSRKGEIRPEYANPIRMLAAAREEVLYNALRSERIENGSTLQKISSKYTEHAAEPTSDVRARTLPSNKDSVLEIMQRMGNRRDSPGEMDNEDHDTTPSFKGLRDVLGVDYHAPTQQVRETLQEYLNSPVEFWQKSSVLSVDKGLVSNDVSAHNEQRPMGPRKQFAVRSQVSAGVIDNLIPENEMVEENYWWPCMGQDEIARAKRNQRMNG